MAELLLELFSEEIPARMQVRAADDLRQLLADGLTKAGLAHDGGRAFSTPRRLVVAIQGIPDAQPDLSEERKGPRVGAPQPAIDGFLRAAGVASLEQCEKRATDKGEFWFAVTQRHGRPARDVLPAIVTAAVAALSWPKSMRFGHSVFRWVRPLHRVLCLFDGRPLDGALMLDDTNRLPFGNISSGHRFLAPGEFTVSDLADLKEKLAAAKVVLDPADRAARITAGAQALAAGEGLSLREDAGLLAEVSGLVEWPVVLMGRIDDAFLDVPAEVLVTSMRTHQKYFALDRADGGLAARFIVVANVEAADQGRAIVAGNERVLRARLSDAKFFWDQDRKLPLAERVPALAKVVFHARLGTMGERVARLTALAGVLAQSIPGCDPAVAREAAGLAKADLTSGMVGEFPELQGIMGRYYARHDGLADDVAEAIAQHYSPLGPNDRCPTAPVAVAVALADKIDALVGFFAIDEKPTGSKDPFALRRAALGIIRLIVENRLRLALTPVFDAAIDLYRPTLGASVPSSVAAALIDFLGDRLKVHLRGEGVRHDLIAAVFGTGGEDDIVRLLARVEALGRLVGSEDGANLLVAYRRASNIVRIEEKKDGPHDGPVDPATLAEAEERTLAEALAAASPGVAAAVAGEQYGEAMRLVAGLRGPVDAFFDRVTVNAPDAALRANRLRLLSEIRRTLDSVADFSRIEG